MTQTFRGDVQGLRAVAVSLVVIGHAHLLGLDGGFVGVDVFFVISGFLITGLLLSEAARTERISLTGFYARRALRILPAATVVSVATVLAATQLLNFVRAKDVLTDSIWTALFAANIKFGRDGTDYFASNGPTSPLQHFWSLAVEEQFYLVWPALLLLVLVVGTRTTFRRRLVPVVLLVAALSLTVSIRQTHTDQVGAYFSTFARAWELAAGALLASCLPLVTRIPALLRAALTWGGLVAVGYAALTFDGGTAFPGTAALLPVLGTVAIIGGGVGDPRFGANRLLARQPFRFVGDISYSLYLWHRPLLVLGAEYAGHPLSHLQNLLLVASAVLLSAASYLLVEDPLRRAHKVWQRRPRRVLLLWPTAVASVLVLAVVAQPATPGGAVARVTAASRTAPQAVVEAVSQAERATAIPANPAPGFAAVKDDFRSIGACSGAHKTSNKVCQFGDPAGVKRMVAFGNSHATMWLPALTPLARTAHWQFMPLVKEACTYTDYVRVTKRAQCSQWYAWALGQLRELRPDLVVLPVYVVADGWESATRQVVADLKALVPRVLVISDAPGIEVAPVDCLLRPNATQRDCLFREDPVHIDADVASRRIAEQERVEYLDVGPWFCSRTLCPSVIDAVVPYVDEQHITATYAELLVPALRPVLKLT